MADTLTPIASVAIDYPDNVTTYAVTVPAGVTTSHLGVLVYSSANAGSRTAASSGWTSRVTNPAGETNHEVGIFTKLGGHSAGGTVTITVSSAAAGRVTMAWYDSQGRDIEAVGTVYTRNGASLATITFPAMVTSGTRNFLLLGTERTAGSVAISSWDNAFPPTVDLYSRSADTAVRATGHMIGRFNSDGSSPQHVVTLTASSTNATGVLMTLAPGAADTAERILIGGVWQPCTFRIV